MTAALIIRSAHKAIIHPPALVVLLLKMTTTTAW